MWKYDEIDMKHLVDDYTPPPSTNWDNKLHPFALFHILKDAQVQISNILWFVDQTNCNASFGVFHTNDLVARTSI